VLIVVINILNKAIKPSSTVLLVVINNTIST
jgi:hypothetical protein